MPSASEIYEEEVGEHKLPFYVKVALLAAAGALVYKIYSPTGGNYISMVRLIKPKEPMPPTPQ